jgi:hypothetical protein
MGVSGESGHPNGGHARAAITGEAGKGGKAGGDGQGEWVQVEYCRAISWYFEVSFTLTITFRKSPENSIST